MKLYGKNNYSSQAMVTKKLSIWFFWGWKWVGSWYICHSFKSRFLQLPYTRMIIYTVPATFLENKLSTGDAFSYVIVFNKPKYS